MKRDFLFFFFFVLAAFPPFLYRNLFVFLSGVVTLSYYVFTSTTLDTQTHRFFRPKRKQDGQSPTTKLRTSSGQNKGEESTEPSRDTHTHTRHAGRPIEVCRPTLFRSLAIQDPRRLSHDCVYLQPRIGKTRYIDQDRSRDRQNKTKK